MPEKRDCKNEISKRNNSYDDKSFTKTITEPSKCEHLINPTKKKTGKNKNEKKSPENVYETSVSSDNSNTNQQIELIKIELKSNQESKLNKIPKRESKYLDESPTSTPKPGKTRMIKEVQKGEYLINQANNQIENDENEPNNSQQNLYGINVSSGNFNTNQITSTMTITRRNSTNSNYGDELSV
jgi:hypothetical protein